MEPAGARAGAASNDTPALAGFKGAVYLAWKGASDNKIWLSEYTDAKGWGPAAALPSDFETSKGPALAVGDTEPTLDFAARFGITAFPDPNSGIIHAENTVEIGPDGRVRSMITENAWQPDEIIADIDNSRGEASNPFARFDLWLSRAAVAICGNNVAAFSGLEDLGIVLLIVAAFGYLLFRLARVIAKA